jgi:hypothetical protein
MSITVSRVAPVAPASELAQEGVPAPGDTPARDAAPDARRAHHRLVTALRAALSAVAELDPDLLGTRTPAGRAAVPMAGTARAAIATLGGDAGMALTHAPGVVVGRDLAVATAQLAAVPASDATPSAARRLADLAAQAERHLADLLRVVTRGV